MNAAFHRLPAVDPADVSESLRHLVAVAAGLAGSVRLVDFDEGVLADWADHQNAAVDWDARLLADVLREGGAGPGAHVVELGCGSGRVGTHLAERGWDVTGVDASAALVDRAPARRPGRRVRWIQADVLTDDVARLVGRPAAAVVAAAGAVGRFLDAEDLVAAFAAVAPLLPAGGPVLVPVLDDSVRAHFEAALPDRLAGRPLRRSNGRQLVVWTAAGYHPPTATLHRAALVSVPEPGGLMHHYAYRVERLWTAGELAAVLAAAGWMQTVSHLAKAEGGPNDGWPFRLGGFGSTGYGLTGANR